MQIKAQFQNQGPIFDEQGLLDVNAAHHGCTFMICVGTDEFHDAIEKSIMAQKSRSLHNQIFLSLSFYYKAILLFFFLSLVSYF